MTSSIASRFPNRAPSILSDINIESRYIDKLADDVRALIEDRFAESLDSGDIIDPDMPEHEEDEIVDAYIDLRESRIIALVLESIRQTI